MTVHNNLCYEKQTALDYLMSNSGVWNTVDFHQHNDLCSLDNNAYSIIDTMLRLHSVITI
jgi:hypothetical protein